MSRQSTDSKSLLERIGCMNGRSAGLVIAFGGGAPALTDRDIAAAVGMARKRNADDTKDASRDPQRPEPASPAPITTRIGFFKTDCCRARVDYGATENDCGAVEFGALVGAGEIQRDYREVLQ